MSYENPTEPPATPAKYDEERNMFTAHVEPCVLSFEDIQYKVPVGRGKEKTIKHILKGINGVAEPGQLLAIMGPSGSGKTSLLNALVGRLPSGVEVTGKILVNNVPLARRTFKRVAGYVLQDDVFFSNLTVKETLEFAANLKMPRGTSDEDVDKRVQEIVSELSLQRCIDTRIGGAFVRGISGGERKRVNVGTELISNPSVLFLDEPTTGLDAFQALNVMNTLRMCASNGRTVICTIHQPRSSIYQLFDSLLLLSEGDVVYFGPSSTARTYFNGLRYSCPEFFNPADYFIDIISIDHRTPEAHQQSSNRVISLVKDYKESTVYQDVVKRINEISKMEPNVHSPLRNGNVSTRQSYFKQLCILFVRSFRQVMRDKFAYVIGLCINIFFAVVVGLIFFRLGHTQTNIQDRTGVLFFSILNIGFGTMSQVLNTFPVEKGIITRERASRMYYISAYYISKVSGELILKSFLIPMVYCAILYWLTNLNATAVAFWRFVLIIFLVSQSANALGLVASALAPNVQVAGALGPLFMIIFMLFGGFYVNQDSIPVWLRWIQYISFVRYGYEPLIINEFMGASFTCTNEDRAKGSCITSGNAVIERLQFKVEESIIWRDVGLLIAVTAVSHFIAFLFIRFKNRGRYLSIQAPAH